MAIHEAAARRARPRGTKRRLGWRRRVRGHFSAPRYGCFQIIGPEFGPRRAVAKIHAVLSGLLPENKTEGLQFVKGSLERCRIHGRSSVRGNVGRQLSGLGLLAKNPGNMLRICVKV